jgi:predicted HAD superfamily Cof-like phosphohydrolase
MKWKERLMQPEKIEDMDAYAKALVGDFIEAFQPPKTTEFWLKLVMEEARELIDETDPVNELKEACDLLYVAAGLALSDDAERVSTPFEQVVLEAAHSKFHQVLDKHSEPTFIKAFNRVHASNMSKLGDDGKPVRREDGKILKGPNYKPALLDDLVEVNE